ncbi:hypothetical protein [Microbacterium tumbae]
MNIDRNLRTRLLAVLPVAALAFSLTACGGAAAERPSVPELSEGITTILDDAGIADQFDDASIDCISEALIASEISDQDLANLAEGKDEQTSQEAFDLVQSEMTTATQECLTAG